MVAIAEVRSANAQFKASNQSLTAVFVGATAGIGLGSLKAFAKNVSNPKVFIVGRSRAKFAPELESLRKLNANGDFQFIEAEVSLLKNIDAVSTQIKSKTDKIDLLFQSQGYISFNGRQENADGLDIAQSLRYYGRLRFVQQLLPILSPDARVVSVLAGGEEGKLIDDDLDLKTHYSVMNAANTSATMTTLAFETLSEEHPTIGFVHYYPGFVKTSQLDNNTTGLLGFVFRWVVTPLAGLFAMSTDVAGERGFHNATSGQFAKGAWTVNSVGTVVHNESVLPEYRKNGTRERIWDHTLAKWEQAA